MARSARQLWRRRSLFAQTPPDHRRELDWRRRAPEEAVASRERPNLLALSECGGGPERRPGRALERAAALLGTKHRCAQRLYRPALQFLQRRNSPIDCAGRTVRHRHRKGAAVRTRRRYRGTVAPERETFRPGP